MRTRFRKLLKLLLISLLCLIGLLATLFGLLQTPWAKGRLADWACAMAGGEDYTIQCQNLRGLLPFNMKLQVVAVSDAKGPLAQVHDLSFSWSPFSLLSDVTAINHISARKIILTRLPDTDAKEEEEDAGAEGWTLPEFPRVRIDELNFPHIELAQELTGEAITFALNGSVETPSLRAFETKARIERIDQPGLQGKIEARTAEGRLRINCDLSGPPDGLLRRIVNLRFRDRLRLQLTGDGPLNAWDGQLLVREGDQTRLDAAFHLNLAEDPFRFRIDATLSPAGLAPGLQHQFIEQQRQMNLAAEGDYSRRTSIFILDSAELTVPAGSIHCSGRVGLRERRVDMTMEVNVAALQELETATPVPLTGAVRATARISGQWPVPQGELTLQADKLKVATVALGDVSFELKAVPRDAGNAIPSQLDVTGQSSASNLIVNGESILTGPVSLSFGVGMDAEADGELVVDTFSVTAEGIALALEGRARGNGALELALTAALEHISTLPHVETGEIDGRVSLSAEATGNWRTRELETSLRLQADRLSGLPEQILGIAGEQPEITATVSFQDNVLRVASAELGLQGAAIQTRGQYDLKEQRLAMNFGLQIPDLSAMPVMAETGIHGTLEVGGSLSGSFEQLVVQTQGTVSDLSYNEIPPSTLNFEISGHNVTTTPSGNIAITLSHSDLHAELQTAYRWDKQVLTLSDVRLAAPDTEGAGRIELGVAERQLDAALRLEINALEWLTPFLPTATQGRLAIEAQAKGALLNPDISLAWTAADLEIGTVAVTSMDGELSASALAEQPHVDLVFSAIGSTVGGITADNLELSLKGDLAQLQMELAVNGSAGAAFSVTTAGTLRLPQVEQEIMLSSGRIEFAGMPLEWTRPMRLQKNGDAFSLDIPEAHLAGGRLQVAAACNDKGILSGRIVLNELRLEEVSLPALPPLYGQVTAALNISGAVDAPQLELQTELTDVSLQADEKGQISFDGRWVVNYREQQLHTSLEAMNEMDDRLNAELSLPLQLSLQPFAAKIAGEVEAKLDASAALISFSPLFLPGSQRLTGQLAATLEVSGPVASPTFNGRLTLQDGQYDNAATGTILRALTLDCSADNRKLNINSISATDGGEGSLNGAGELLFTREPSGRASLKFQDMTLLRMETATGTVGGNLSLSFSPGSSQVEGTLTLAPVELRIPDPQPQGMEGITVVQQQKKKKDDGDTEESSDAEAEVVPSPLQDLTLDIRITIPGRCYIRGRGLTSEWQGDLSITGKAAEPVVSGDVSVIRGRASFLTKRFILEEGTVRFGKERPPQPILDVLAVNETGDMIVRLRVAGPVNDPVMSLSSEPTYPRDEILARLMFGKDLSQITPLQAVRLALAVRTLTGSGVGITEKLRRGFGLADLELRTTEEGQTVVGVGKYLAEDVYFRVEQGAGTDLTQVVVEVELTPHMSVETRSGSGSQGIDLKWRYRY